MHVYDREVYKEGTSQFSRLMADSPIHPTILKGLCDKLYEKRKAAAFDLEKLSFFIIFRLNCVLKEISLTGLLWKP